MKIGHLPPLPPVQATPLNVGAVSFHNLAFMLQITPVSQFQELPALNSTPPESSCPKRLEGARRGRTDTRWQTHLFMLNVTAVAS